MTHHAHEQGCNGGSRTLVPPAGACHNSLPPVSTLMQVGFPMLQPSIPQPSSAENHGSHSKSHCVSTCSKNNRGRSGDGMGCYQQKR